MKTRIFILAVAIFLAASAQAQLVGPPGPFQGFKSTDQEPIEIHADRMEADLTTGRLLFSGHVSAKQGKRVIYAESLQVSYTQDGKITVMEALGNVKVKMDDAFASADRLVLDNTQKVIRLLGSPRVVQGKQIVIGEKITYEIGPEKLVVTSPRIEWIPEPAGEAEDKSPEAPDSSNKQGNAPDDGEQGP